MNVLSSLVNERVVLSGVVLSYILLKEGKIDRDVFFSLLEKYLEDYIK